MMHTQIFTPDQLHHGFGKFDDLGCGVNYDLYQINIERADAKHQQPCNHCGRGLNPDTAFIAMYAYNHQRFISTTVEVEQLMSYKARTSFSNISSGVCYETTSLAWSWVFLGTECAKQLPAAFKIRLKDFQNSKFNDTEAHHQANWGTW